ncbi:MAG TPA: alpha/beta hydrolase [Spirochaetia bacterium]|nr:alpha/beta hydrolase [Spirochaetia bacterium]
METWVDVNGMRIHCLEAGTAEEGQTPLVLVHGWTGSAADWEPLLAALPPGIRAVAPDFPGCGLSDKPEAPYDMSWFLDFLRAFCVAIGASTLVPVGHSMGGQVAVHFTAHYPAMVEKLVLIDPFGLRAEETRLSPLARIGPLVNAAFALNRRAFIERAVRANVLHNPSPELVKAAVDSTAASILDRDGARANARITRQVIGRSHVDALLPGISQATLVIWGKEDRLLPPRWAEPFTSLLPRVSLELVPGAGHMPMFEKPAEVAQAMTRFLSR